jgi:peroxiredoxin
MKEAADVVIVIESGEEGLRFVVGKAESGERDGFAGLMRKKVVAVNEFTKGQHGNAARGFTTHDSSGRSVSPEGAKGKRENWRGRRGLGKMLGGTYSTFFEEERTMSLTVGQTAPDFTLKDQTQKEVKLSDFAGKKKVVLVFYPLDWSPVCTNEHACFVNDMKQFETLDAEVLGVSVDSVWSHKAYAEKMGIKYSLLADFHPKGAMSGKYGVYLGEKGITGRAIFIIDKAGKVAWAKNYDIPLVPDIKEVATALGSVK